MNPGYLSLLLICISLVLFASGWKDILLRGISHKVILLFFVLWFISVFLTVAVSEEVHVNMVFALLTAFSFFSFMGQSGALRVMHSLSASLLFASLYFAYEELSSLEPFVLTSRLHFDVSLLLGAAATILYRQPLRQIGVLSLSLVLGELLLYTVNRQYAPYVLGNELFRDRWWLAVFSARVMSVSTEYLLAWGKGMKEHWVERRKGTGK